MMKAATRMMFLAIGLVTALSTASAIGFNEFRTNCANNGGDLDGNGSGATCTFVEEKTVPASHSSGDWEVDVEQEIVQTWNDGTATGVSEVEGDVVVTGCRNAQGNEVGGFATNPNCQPAP